MISKNTTPLRAHVFAVALAATVAAAAAGGAGCDGGDDGPKQSFTVYTRNVYLGSSLTPLIAVATPDAVPAVAAEIWANVQASDFPARAKVLAAEIADLRPDLVALQEVTLYRRQVPSDNQASPGTPNATEVVLDFLATIMTELDARGGGYRVAVEAGNADAELPVADGAGGLFDIRVTDRDVILVRDGVVTANPVVLPFAAKYTLTVGGAGGVPVTFARGRATSTSTSRGPSSRSRTRTSRSGSSRACRSSKPARCWPT